jgi:hypothetical protein
MQMGARIYANSSATTFQTTPTYTFDWYRTDIDYSDELEEVVEYKDEQVETAETKELEFDLSSTFADEIAFLEQCKADPTITGCPDYLKTAGDST